VLVEASHQEVEMIGLRNLRSQVFGSAGQALGA